MLSNADPKRTFLGLVDDGGLPDRFRAAVAAYRCEGTSMKINLAVDRLPRRPDAAATGVQPYLGGIMEFGRLIADMDRAQCEARAGRPAPTRTSSAASRPSTIPHSRPRASTC